MIDLDFLGSLTAEAGRAILEIYNTFSAEKKRIALLLHSQTSGLTGLSLRGFGLATPIFLSSLKKKRMYLTRPGWNGVDSGLLIHLTGAGGS